MKYQKLVSVKINKHVIYLSSAESAHIHVVVKVKNPKQHVNL